MMQVTTMIQGSFAFRAVNPFVKMTDSPIKHTTGKKEKDRVSDGELAACIGSEYHHLHEAKVQWKTFLSGFLNHFFQNVEAENKS